MGRMNYFTSVLSRGNWDCQFLSGGVVAEIQYSAHTESFIFFKREVEEFGANGRESWKEGWFLRSASASFG